MWGRNVAFMKAAKRKNRRANVRQIRDNVRYLGRNRIWGAVGSDQNTLILDKKRNDLKRT